MFVKESIFVFDNQLYQQKDGVAMGSLLGPTLRNLFLCFHETSWLPDCLNEFNPIKYSRHIEYLNIRNMVVHFLITLNKNNKNMSFTAEYEHNNQRLFLDVLIMKKWLWCTDY